MHVTLDPHTIQNPDDVGSHHTLLRRHPKIRKSNEIFKYTFRKLGSCPRLIIERTHGARQRRCGVNFKTQVSERKNWRTRRLGAGQSYCAMFTSLAAPRGDGNHRPLPKRARTICVFSHHFIAPPLFITQHRHSFPPHAPCSLFSPRVDGGDLQFWGGWVLFAARGGCRRGFFLTRTIRDRVVGIVGDDHRRVQGRT